MLTKLIQYLSDHTDRSELALAGAVAYDAMTVAIDFGLQLTPKQETDLAGLGVALTALAAAYLVHRQGKAA